MRLQILSSLTFLILTHSHSIVTSPLTRVVGAAMKAVCGEQVFNNLKSNAYGPIEQLQQIGSSQKDFDPAACDVIHAVQGSTIRGQHQQRAAVYRGELPKNQTEFEVTMPDVKAQCGMAGQCVMQWWWDSKEAKQTYMSCVDFTM
ncbi:hypothetical protein BKA65DRAFT_545712 [Rhexocercosporidium sp. MPI-PUGE-AT-0058]|nr:hypothetical protein BKA65DRAFT_545712 [Rhexocercosporidium sp. MPI-PUGE-AT-0058]